jgi:hypothetical protein
MRKSREYPIPPADRIGLDEVCGATGLGLAGIRHAVDGGLLRGHRLGRRVIVTRADVSNF